VSADAAQGQLEWERRNGGRAAAAAFAAALLPFVSNIILAGTSSAEGGGTAGRLLAAEERAGAYLAGTVLGVIGVLVLPPALGYLYRATRARRPEAPRLALPLLIAAAVATAALLVAQTVALIDVAGEFVVGDVLDEETADDLLADSTYASFGLPFLIANAVLGVGVILISLHAMRAGLLSRFMGIIGMAVGAFYILLALGGPLLIQLFWLVALGLLFLGRWPGGGRGPAWERVEAMPWPTAAQRIEADRAARVGEAQRVSEGQEPPDERPDAVDGGPEPRPASRKRRRGR
jgi:hypothetical protein